MFFSSKWIYQRIANRTSRRYSTVVMKYLRYFKKLMLYTSAVYRQMPSRVDRTSRKRYSVLPNCWTLAPVIICQAGNDVFQGLSHECISLLSYEERLSVCGRIQQAKMVQQQPPTSIDLGNGHHTKGTKNKKGGNDPIGELQEKLLIRKKAGFVELDLVDWTHQFRTNNLLLGLQTL